MDENNSEKKEDNSVSMNNSVSNKKPMTHKIRENPWILSTVVLGIFAFIFIITSLSGSITGNVVSTQAIGDQLLTYFTVYLK